MKVRDHQFKTNRLNCRLYLVFHRKEIPAVMKLPNLTKQMWG